MTESILVVDDESLVRNVCTAVLTNAGYKTLSADGGHSALRMLKSTPEPVHLAVLDIRMPKMSGVELLLELIECLEPVNHDIGFILMSGYPDSNVGDLAYRRDIHYSFLWKPFMPSALLAAVRRQLDTVTSPLLSGFQVR